MIRGEVRKIMGGSGNDGRGNEIIMGNKGWESRRSERMYRR